MNCTRLQELAAAQALGILEAPEAAHLQALATSDPDIRAEVAAFQSVTSALLLLIKPVTPPARVREHVLDRIRRTPPHPAPELSVNPPGPDLSGFRFLRPAEGEWSPGPHPGTRMQVLATDWRRNYLMVYLELEPGATFPEHDHSASEELFLVRGDLLTEGRILRAGDFIHGDPGSHHQELISPSGCQAILLTSLTSALGEMAKAGVKRTATKLLGGLGLDAK